MSTLRREPASPSPTRPFLRFSLKRLLLLMAILAGLAMVWGRQIAEYQQRRTTAIAEYQQRRTTAINQALADAAATGDIEAARQAIANGAHVDAVDADFHTPLYYALLHDDVAMFHFLIEHGADPNQPDLWNKSLLAVAVEANNLDMAKRLFAVGADPNGTGEDDGLLLWCVQHAQPEMLKLLLEHGANVDLRAGPAMYPTALRAAMAANSSGRMFGVKGPISREAQLSMVRLLLEHGADSRAVHAGQDPLDFAVSLADGEVGDLLVQYGADYGPREAVAFNRLEDVKRFVAEDPDVLHREFTTVHGFSYTPLGLALARNYEEIAVFLIEAGAPLDFRDGAEEVTALHGPAIHGNVRLLKLLIARGVDVNAAGVGGGAPLHEAASRGQVESVAALIDAGAEVNLQGMGGTTPLWRAAYGNHLQVAQLLLAAGADPNIIADYYGTNAFDVARERMNDEMLQLLESVGKDRDIEAQR